MQPLDRGGGTTLQEQIYQGLRTRIALGALPSGTRLAATREAARALGVSRNTVVLAYERLTSEGYVEMRPGQGAFVARQIIDPVLADAPPAPAPLPAEEPRPAFDLWYARTDPRLFPAHIWRRLGSTALSACAMGLSSYGPLGGDPRLRRAIAAHLAAHRGIAAHPEQVVVTSGAQEAFNLVARLVLIPGDDVVVEDPGYTAVAQVFTAHGARLHSCPVDREGLDVTQIQSVRPRLVCVTPAHQFPTGVAMSAPRRRALLAFCAAHGSLVVEDDYDGEIVFDRPPAPALSAMSPSQHTIFVGSFSKTLGSGLRLGYLVVPLRLAAAAQAAKRLLSYGQSWLDQQILAAFLEEGRYRRHLNRLRTACRARRDAAREGIARLFGGDAIISGAEGGLHLHCTLPENAPDAARLAVAARTVGVGLHTAADCGVRGDAAMLARTLLIGFGALTPDELALAFARLERAFAALPPPAFRAFPGHLHG